MLSESNLTSQERQLSELRMDEITASLGERVVVRKMLGDSDANLVAKLCRLGLSAEVAREAIANIISERLHSERALKRKRRQLESLLDAHRRLRQLGAGAGKIARLHKPSPAEFLDNYYAKGEPVVLTGLFDDWPALKWSPSNLRDRFGDVEVEVMTRRNSDPNFELNKGEHKARMRFRDFIELVEGPPTNDVYMVAHNFALPGPLASLAREILPIPGLLHPPDNLTEINLWLGPEGTVTPLHHDSSNVLLGQMFGRKRLIVFPWSEVHLLYNEVAGFSRFDPEAPDFAKYPLAQRATPSEVTLESGDALFIPVGAWHHVRALSPSISLSMSQFVFPNRFSLYDP